MAISYVDVAIVTRGQSTQGTCTSVAKKAAYISGQKISCEYTDETYFYPRKHREVIYTEIFLPEHAPERLLDRATLWNEVEWVERQRNAQLAREIKVALPRELSNEQNIALARGYTRKLAEWGMAADLCVHDKGDGNPHAHILVTMRPFTADGAWGLKSREEFLLDAHGQKIRLPSGRYKSFKVRLTTWDDKATLLAWRQLYEDVTNEHLEQAGISTRISVKSYVEQGREREPMVHLGPYVHRLEQQGVQTYLGDLNREREKRNRLRDLFLQQFDAWVKTAKERLKQEAKQRDAQEQELSRPVATRVQEPSKSFHQQAPRQTSETLPHRLFPTASILLDGEGKQLENRKEEARADGSRRRETLHTHQPQEVLQDHMACVETALPIMDELLTSIRQMVAAAAMKTPSPQMHPSTQRAIRDLHAFEENKWAPAGERGETIHHARRGRDTKRNFLSAHSKSSPGRKISPQSTWGTPELRKPLGGSPSDYWSRQVWERQRYPARHLKDEREYSLFRPEYEGRGVWSRKEYSTQEPSVAPHPTKPFWERQQGRTPGA